MVVGFMSAVRGPLKQGYNHTYQPSHEDPQPVGRQERSLDKKSSTSLNGATLV